MRKFQIAAALAFGAVLFAGAQPARAQETNTMTATVSFPFMVGTVMMPAGSYEIIPVGMDADVLEIQSENGHIAAFATVLRPTRRPIRARPSSSSCTWAAVTT